MRASPRAQLLLQQFGFRAKGEDGAPIPAMFYAQSIASFASHSNVAAYWQRAPKRPSYAKVMVEFEPIWKGIIASQQVV